MGRHSRTRPRQSVNTHLSLRHTRTFTGPKDHLWLSPVVYDKKDVIQRASEVQHETEMQNVEDAAVEVLSPYISFCIADGERSFTVLHGDFLNRIPGRPSGQRPLTTRFVDPELLHGCYWSINAIPYMGFLPVNPYAACFNDPLFSCVFERKWEVPMEKDGDQWRLALETLRQWQHLEKILVWLRELLSASLPLRGSQEHLPAPLPSYYRFHRPLSDATTFAKRIVRARYAFLLIGAEISFLYALQANQETLVIQLKQRIYQEFKLEALVDALLESWMFIPSSGYYRSHHGYGKQGCPRHGMFVDAASCTMAHALAAYEIFRVPLWFWWGNRTQTHTPQSAYIARRFGFNRDMVQQFLTASGSSRPTADNPPLFLPINYKKPHDQRPDSFPVQVITEQSLFAALPDEQWFEFIARRDRTTLACPVPSREREVIHRRQNHAQSHGFDAASALFRWVPARGSDMLVRRRVPAFKASRVWGEYRPCQRIYCAIFDEWDLCEQFTAPNLNVMLVWEEKGSCVQPEHGNGAHPQALSPPACSSSVAANYKPSPEQRSGLPPPATAAQTIGCPLRSRSPVGFEGFPSPNAPQNVAAVADEPPLLMFTPPEVCAAEQEDSRAVDDPQEGARIDWKTAYAALYPASKRRIYTEKLSGLPSLMQVLRDFYGLYPPSVSTLKPSQHQPPNELRLRLLKKFSCYRQPQGVDTPLNQEALMALDGYCDHVAWYARGEELFAQPDKTCVCDWSDIDEDHPEFVLREDVLQRLGVEQMYRRGRKEHTFYFHWPERSLQIVLFRASNLLWVLRQHRVSRLEDVVLALAITGIRFSLTVINCTPALQKEVLTPPVPWRPHPWHANVADFGEYLGRRHRLLSSPFVLRAALMSGGLLWRLAMEHSPDPAILLSCTNEYVERYGERSSDSNGTVICELALSESQIDTIVGTYIVGRAYPPNARNDLEMSWFPRKIETAGFNVGFWSADAEWWYQGRLQQCINGTAQPQTQKTWRKSLKLYRPAHRFSKGYEVLARSKVAAMAIPVVRSVS